MVSKRRFPIAIFLLVSVAVASVGSVPQVLAQYALDDGPMQPQPGSGWRPRGSGNGSPQAIAMRQHSDGTTTSASSALPAAKTASRQIVPAGVQQPAEDMSPRAEVVNRTASRADGLPAYQRVPRPALALRKNSINARWTPGDSKRNEEDPNWDQVEVIPPGHPQPAGQPDTWPEQFEPEAGAFGPSYSDGGCCGQDFSGTWQCEDAYGPMDCDGCGMCPRCWGLYDPYPPGCGWGLLGMAARKFMRDVSLFSGPHAFRGPMDFGANGNFGFHWGANLGGATGIGNIGYQVGFAIATSNLKANEIGQFTITTPNGTAVVGYDRSNRNQYFFTAGLFKRALCGGIQWGVAFDLLRDEYYDQMNLKQIRSETSYVFRGGRHEIGYFGHYQTSDDVVRIAQVVQDRVTTLVAPTDIYAAFYRQYFANGSEARLWGGVTGRGQAVVGGDVRVPLGGPVAIETSYNYIIPNSTRDVTNQTRFQETWGININLVWYPGRSAACVHTNQFRPLLGVADNSSLMVRTGDPVWR